MITVENHTLATVAFYHRGLRREYKVWCTKGIWYWSAAGNEQSAATCAEAQQAAREWITNGQ